MKKRLFSVISLIVGAAAGFACCSYLDLNKLNNVQKKVDKFKEYYNILNQWLILKQEENSSEKYFIENKYKTVSIYGMGEIGNRLYEELKNSSEIEVKYGIDNNASETYSELEVLSLEEYTDLAADDIDVIVVTATFAFDDIKKSLSELLDCNIISIEDVVYGV